MQIFGTSVTADDASLLLPWHAAGTLPLRQARGIEVALGRDAALARSFAAVRKEQTAVIAANERLGAPSPRVLRALFAAIDADRVAVKSH